MESKVDLDAVLAALRELSVGTSSSPEAFLLDHGLRVHPTLERWTYAPTPVNSVTFASTGGDGVHFGLLQGLSTTSRDGPVVMTVPMAALDHVRDANHVVAESIREFLGLGCVRGWCELEQLAYRSEYALKLHSRAVAPSEPRIAQLFDRLSLDPVALQSSRLQELSRRYDSTIVIAPEEERIQEPTDIDAFLAWKRATYGES